MICRPSYSVISGSFKYDCYYQVRYSQQFLDSLSKSFFLIHLSLSALSELRPALDDKQPLVVDHVHLDVNQCHNLNLRVGPFLTVPTHFKYKRERYSLSDDEFFNIENLKEQLFWFAKSHYPIRW